jgi:hypothetical protein
MEPPQGESPGPSGGSPGEGERRPAGRSSRLLGLLAAVGFSIAMWAFIGMAVLGLILKVFASRH